ncbi:hypothetical protein BDN67DRAFT_976541 [Paxillus ammoniavirescens]|nr:hypothetical protein BDN67DRAFT_976541 [Paxillus ammoniavirescens]
MTSVIDALNVDVGVVGNHEFDFGYPRLSELVKNTAFVCLYFLMFRMLTRRSLALAP